MDERSACADREDGRADSERRTDVRDRWLQQVEQVERWWTPSCCTDPIAVQTLMHALGGPPF